MIRLYLAGALLLLVVAASVAGVWVSQSRSNDIRSRAEYISGWGFISGMVYDDRTGKAIEKAIVAATGPGGTIEKKTNPYGAWGMSFSQHGTYTVTISRPRYVTQTFSVYASDSATPTITRLVLVR